MSLRVAAVALAAIGMLGSAYLTWVHYSGQLALCFGAGGCETVQASRYAMVGAVPVAVLGLLAFGAVFALAGLRLRPEPPTWLFTALFGVTLAGTLFAAYLTYVELFVIKAICPWCVVVDSAMAVSFVLTLVELRRSP